jgi:hypothetical protein
MVSVGVTGSGVSVGVNVGKGLGLGVNVKVGVSEAVTVGVKVGLAVTVFVSVFVAVFVAVRVRVLVGVREAVRLGVGVNGAVVALPGGVSVQRGSQFRRVGLTVWLKAAVRMPLGRAVASPARVLMGLAAAGAVKVNNGTRVTVAAGASSDSAGSFSSAGWRTAHKTINESSARMIMEAATRATGFMVFLCWLESN